jgi:hypothetical protein
MGYSALKWSHPVNPCDTTGVSLHIGAFRRVAALTV